MGYAVVDTLKLEPLHSEQCIHCIVGMIRKGDDTKSVALLPIYCRNYGHFEVKFCLLSDQCIVRKISMVLAASKKQYFSCIFFVSVSLV